MRPHLRKLALTAHVASSVGWLGAVAAFLALAVAGLTSGNAQTVLAAYLAMELTAWFVIVPLALASLLTGVVSSLGTKWGLFRHYWVLVKLLLTLFATAVLLLKLEPISYVANVVAETSLSGADLHQARMSLVAHSGGGLLALIVATVLGVYKPWGTTRYGRRKHIERRLPSRPILPRRQMTMRNRGVPQVAESTSHIDANSSAHGIHVRLSRRSTSSGTPRWVKVSGIIAVIHLVLLLAILHLTGSGVGGH